MNTTYEYQTKVVIGLGDVYNPGATEPPKGFKLTGEFRPPKAGEFFLACPNGDAIQEDIDYAVSMPRLILTAAPIRKQLVFTETGETRVPKRGEWFRSSYTPKQPLECCFTGEFLEPHKILTLEVREIQEP